MGKGLGCNPSKSYIHQIGLASTIPSSNVKLEINSSLVPTNEKILYNNGDFEELLARAQAAKITNDITLGPQWTREQYILSQK